MKRVLLILLALVTAVGVSSALASSSQLTPKKHGPVMANDNNDNGDKEDCDPGEKNCPPKKDCDEGDKNCNDKEDCDPGEKNCPPKKCDPDEERVNGKCVDKCDKDEQRNAKGECEKKEKKGTGKVSGVVYDDANHNGTLDKNAAGTPTEPGLGGWKVTIINLKTGFENTTLSSGTNGIPQACKDSPDTHNNGKEGPAPACGGYSFSGLPAGTYYVCVTVGLAGSQSAGWIQTEPTKTSANKPTNPSAIGSQDDDLTCRNHTGSPSRSDEPNTGWVVKVGGGSNIKNLNFGNDESCHGTDVNQEGTESGGLTGAIHYQIEPPFTTSGDPLIGPVILHRIVSCDILVGVLGDAGL